MQTAEWSARVWPQLLRDQDLTFLGNHFLHGYTPRRTSPASRKCQDRSFSLGARLTHPRLQSSQRGCFPPLVYLSRSQVSTAVVVCVCVCVCVCVYVMWSEKKRPEIPNGEKPIGKKVGFFETSTATFQRGKPHVSTSFGRKPAPRQVHQRRDTSPFARSSKRGCVSRGSSENERFR